MAPPFAVIGILVAASWYFNLGGLPGGLAAVLVGLPLAALLVSRLSLRHRTEPGLWMATIAVTALVAAGVVTARAAPGHAELEQRLDRLPGLERVGPFERQGSSTCQPRCASVTARYALAGAADVAVASLIAVLSSDGFEPDADGSLVFASEEVHLHQGRTLAIVRAAPEESSVRVTLRGRR